jgi:hypothetical protein
LKSSELIELLASLKPTLPVRVRDGSEMLFIGQVYHEPLNTFIQGAVIEGKYSTVQALLDRLRHIDKIIPFDPDIVSGDDWNYQETTAVMSEDMLTIELSMPVFSDDEDDDVSLY